METLSGKKIYRASFEERGSVLQSMLQKYKNYSVEVLDYSIEELESGSITSCYRHRLAVLWNAVN